MRLWQSAWSFISLALALAPDFSVGRRLASSMPLDAIWYVALSIVHFRIMYWIGLGILLTVFSLGIHLCVATNRPPWLLLLREMGNLVPRLGAMIS